MSNNRRIKDLCQIAAFTAIICIVSQISIPLPAGVPMTLQTFIIPLAAVVLGTKKGTISAAIYVMLGAVGVPVFSGMTGGLDKLLGMTGGFIISFPLLAFLTGIGYAVGRKASARAGKHAIFYVVFIAGLIAGTLVNYGFGTIWFSMSTGNSISYSFAACVLPFIPTSVIKILMVTVLGPMLRKVMVRSGVLEALAR